MARPMCTRLAQQACGGGLEITRLTPPHPKMPLMYGSTDHWEEQHWGGPPTLHPKSWILLLHPHPTEAISPSNYSLPTSSMELCLLGKLVTHRMEASNRNLYIQNIKSFNVGLHRDFPGSPVVKNPPSNAGDAGLIPGQGTKIPHAAGQLSPLAATTEPTCRS